MQGFAMLAFSRIANGEHVFTGFRHYAKLRPLINWPEDDGIQSFGFDSARNGAALGTSPRSRRLR